MKLSTVVVLFTAAVATVLPGVSAATESLRGTLPDKETSFFNCQTRSYESCVGNGYNTCVNLQNNCGLCYWSGSKTDGYCYDVKPTRRPTPKPNTNRNSCNIGSKTCSQNGQSQFCHQYQYGDCANTNKGYCSYYTGGCNNQGPQVCGCNNKTYKNACTAYAGGMNVAYSGPCKSNAEALLEESASNSGSGSQDSGSPHDSLRGGHETEDEVDGSGDSFTSNSEDESDFEYYFEEDVLQSS